MTYHVSDCHGARIVYLEAEVPVCIECWEECELVKVPPDKDEIAVVKAERRTDR
jgi:hypothetical protein